MKLAIHPETLNVKMRIAKGQRVVWLETMQYLFCFGRNHPGNSYIHAEWTPAFEVLRAFYSPETVGVCLTSFRSQLALSDYLIAGQDGEGRIRATAVLEHWEEWSRENGRFEERYLERIAKARHFLEAEDIWIPQVEWMKALPPRRH